MRIADTMTHTRSERQSISYYISIRREKKDNSRSFGKMGQELCHGGAWHPGAGAEGEVLQDTRLRGKVEVSGGRGDSGVIEV
jgi:hypothetical protein